MIAQIKPPHLFISYAHKDLKPVKKIKVELNKRGFNTWFDEDDIVGGRKWEEEIYQGIDHCSGLILMLSPNALASDWVGKEWRRAKVKNKPIIPVLLASVHTNPVPDIQWVDFQQYQDDERFFYATYSLVRAVHESTDYPEAKVLLEKIQNSLGSARIAEHLNEIRESRRATERWLNDVEESCGTPPDTWQVAVQPEEKIITDRLVNLAIGTGIQDSQIMLHAAQTIGKCGNRTALVAIARQVQDGSDIQVFNALRTIWETRQDGIPDSLLGRSRWRVKAYIGWRQFREPGVLPVLLFAIFGACLGLMVTIYTEFYDPSGTFPLTQLSYVVSNGISYALFIGAGIAITYILVPRLRILRQMRFIVAAVSGWVVITLTFIVLNVLFYIRVPDDWSSVLWLSFLFIFGYAICAVIRPNSLLRTIIRMVIAFTGVFAALAIPCDWSPLPGRLLYFFQGNCLLKACLVSVLIVVTSFMPEIVEHINQRGSTFQQFRSRFRKTN